MKTCPLLHLLFCLTLVGCHGPGAPDTTQDASLSDADGQHDGSEESAEDRGGGQEADSPGNDLSEDGQDRSPCLPNCAGRHCGPDPVCGISCGDCAEGWQCREGTCQPGSSASFDVLIVGAGTSGCAAAIQAARSGMTVALLEETDWVGGQAVAVPTMDESVAREYESGVYREWIDRIVEHYHSRGKSIGTCYWSAATHCFEPRVGQEKLLELLAEAGRDGGQVELFLRERPLEVTRVGQTVTGIITRSGKHFWAQVVVDATEYGDLLPLAGAAYRVGQSTSDNIDENDCIQDITYTAMMKKYPAGVPAEFFLQEKPPGTDEETPYFARIVARGGSPWISYPVVYPVDFVNHNAYRGLPDSTNPQNYTAANRQQAELISKTEINFANDYPARAAYNPPPEGNPTLSVRYLEDPAYRFQINCQAKLRTLQFLYYVQHQLEEPLWAVAGDEGFDTPFNRQENLCPQIPETFKPIERQFPSLPYVRESRRLVGVYTLSARDIFRSGQPPVAAKLFETAVAMGGYPNDLHNCNRDEHLESEFEDRSLVSGSGRFQVPFEALIPQDLEGFLPAEKNFSQTRLANGATRLQPTTMLIGQAVGALAAQAVRLGVSPRRVPPLLVQNDLVNAGVELWVLPFGDVPRGDDYWADVQIAAVRGIMRGYGNGLFGRDDPLARGQMAVVLVRLLNLPLSPPAQPTFQDVPPDHPFYAEIEALAASGISAGCSADPPMFCPDDATLRYQLAVFLVRALGLDIDSAPTQPFFSDVDSSEPFFRHVQAVVAAKLMVGCSPGRFCPQDPLPRAPAAAVARAVLLYRP